MCVWEGEGVVCVGEGVCVLRGEFNMEFTPYTHHMQGHSYSCFHVAQKPPACRNVGGAT